MAVEVTPEGMANEVVMRVRRRGVGFMMAVGILERCSKGGCGEGRAEE